MWVAPVKMREPLASGSGLTQPMGPREKAQEAESRTGEPSKKTCVIKGVGPRRLGVQRRVDFGSQRQCPPRRWEI